MAALEALSASRATPSADSPLPDQLVERKSLKMTIVFENSKARHDVKGARLAVTRYRVLERLPGHTVVEVKLETGRRNQIPAAKGASTPRPDLHWADAPQSVRCVSSHWNPAR